MNPRLSLVLGIALAVTLAGCGKTLGVAPQVSRGAPLAEPPAIAPRRNLFPPTPGGIHLNLVFNYRVTNLHREIGVVDVVWGSR